MTASENEQSVFVRSAGSGGASKTVYHTDPDCPRMKAANKMVKKPLKVLHSDIRICSYCSGESGPNIPGKQDHLNALKEYAKQQNDNGENGNGKKEKEELRLWI